MNPEVHGLLKTMAAFVDNSSLDVSERRLMAIMLNIHTKSHTVLSRPTLKLRVFWEQVGLQTLWEINLGAILYQKLLWNAQKKGQETEGICFRVYSSKHTEVLLATLLCEGWKSYKECLQASHEECKIK